MEKKEIKAIGGSRKTAELRISRLLAQHQAQGWQILHVPGRHGWIVTEWHGAAWCARITLIRSA